MFITHHAPVFESEPDEIARHFHGPTPAADLTTTRSHFSVAAPALRDHDRNNGEWTSPGPATLWRGTVESWLRCQALIGIRQSQKWQPIVLKLAP
jgi:hypothetical protein